MKSEQMASEDTRAGFYLSARERFPELTEKADRRHIAHWSQPPNVDADSYIWFESVAHALNASMSDAANLKEFKAFLDFVRAAFCRSQCEEVKTVIEVALVENLFWKIASDKAEPYWSVMPEVLRGLYIRFHSRPPVYKSAAG